MMNGKARPLETFPRGGGVGTARRFATLHRGPLAVDEVSATVHFKPPLCKVAKRRQNKPSPAGSEASARK